MKTTVYIVVIYIVTLSLYSYRDGSMIKHILPIKALSLSVIRTVVILLSLKLTFLSLGSPRPLDG